MRNLIDPAPKKSSPAQEKSPIPANPAALQFCWHIRVGMFRQIDPLKMKAYADFFYHTYLDPHLSAQEQLLTSNPDLPPGLVRRIMISQRRLRRLFEEGKDITRSLGQIEDALEQHVRLEQRSLFPELAALRARKGDDPAKLGRQFYDPLLAAKLDGWKERYWALD